MDVISNTVVIAGVIAGGYAVFRYLKTGTGKKKEGICNVCEGLVSPNARKRPHCGDPNPHGKISKLKIGIAAALSLFIIGTFAPDSRRSTSPSNSDTVLYEAEEICKSFVRDSLKAPSSAVFENPSGPAATLLDDGTYQVYSWVEAQNAFSAQLRTNYSCNISRLPNGKWTLNNLDVE